MEAAWNAERNAVEASYAEFFSSNGVDALLTPTHPIAPVRIEGKWDGTEDDGAAYNEKGGFAPIFNWIPMARYVRKFNEIKAPSVVVPTPARHAVVAEAVGSGASKSSEGLPAGVLIWGPPNADSRVLRLGMALEQEFLLGAEDEVR